MQLSIIRSITAKSKINPSGKQILDGETNIVSMGLLEVFLEPSESVDTNTRKLAHVP